MSKKKFGVFGGGQKTAAGGSGTRVSAYNGKGASRRPFGGSYSYGGTWARQNTAPQMPPELTPFEEMLWDISVGEIPENPTKQFTRCLFRDGHYILERNRLGHFFGKSKTTTTGQGLPKCPRPLGFVRMTLPKIPVGLICHQVSFYAEVAQKLRNAEAYTCILWDMVEERYLIDVPDQRVTSATATYDRDSFFAKYPPDRYLEIASCHSHGSMGAFFSGTDDADEKAGMFYIVIGKNNTRRPEIKVRAAVDHGGHINLRPSDIIEGWIDGPVDWPEPRHPKEWISRVNSSAWRHGSQKKSLGATTYGSSYGGAYGTSNHDDDYGFDWDSYRDYAGGVATSTSTGGRYSEEIYISRMLRSAASDLWTFGIEDAYKNVVEGLADSTDDNRRLLYKLVLSEMLTRDEIPVEAFENLIAAAAELKDAKAKKGIDPNKALPPIIEGEDDGLDETLDLYPIGEDEIIEAIDVDEDEGWEAFMTDGASPEDRHWSPEKFEAYLNKIHGEVEADEGSMSLDEDNEDDDEEPVTVQKFRLLAAEDVEEDGGAPEITPAIDIPEQDEDTEEPEADAADDDD